jgi:hypothetical protein
MQLCEYGCGKEAKYQFKNGKWCCSIDYRKCPELRKKYGNPGSKNPMFGRKHSKKTKEKMSVKASKRRWSDEYKKKMSIKIKSVKHKIFTKETRKKISEACKGREVSEKTRKKISLANRYTIIKLKEKYPIFAKIEEMRYKPENEKEIQVHCKNHLCQNSKEQGGWFTPTSGQISGRLAGITFGNDGSYFYCCNDCKQICPLYRLKAEDEISRNNINKNKYYTDSEYQTFRHQVLKREDYICEYCEELANHVHHSRPQKLEPGFILDPDFGVACCESCHYKYGHKDECSTENLKKVVCK